MLHVVRLKHSSKLSQLAQTREERNMGYGRHSALEPFTVRVRRFIAKATASGTHFELALLDFLRETLLFYKEINRTQQKSYSHRPSTDDVLDENMEGPIKMHLRAS